MAIPANQPFYLNDRLVDPILDCVSRDGMTVRVDQPHMQVLLVLARHAGEIVSVRRIEDAVWGDEAVTPNALHQAIAQLRRALGDNSKAPKYIQTVPRRGYRLIAHVGPELVALEVIDNQPAVAEPVAIYAAAEAPPTDIAAPTLEQPPVTASPRVLDALKKRWMVHWKIGSLAVGGLIAVGACMAWAHLEAKEAEYEGVRADQLATFMVNVFSDSGTSEHRQQTAQELMHKAVQRISSDLQQQPAVRAQMLDTVARSYIGSGLSAQALPPLREALSIRRRIGAPTDLRNTLLSLGDALRDVGKHDDSERAYREALQLEHTTFGEDTWNHALAIARLGKLEACRGQPRKALVLLNESLQRMRQLQGPRHSDVAKILMVINLAHRWNSDLQSAERVAREAIDILQKSKPGMDPDRITAEFALGVTLRLQGRTDAAASIMERVLDAQRQLFDSKGADIAATLDTLGNIRFEQKRVAEGERLKAEAIAVLISLGQGSDEQRGYIQEGLAIQLLELGQFARSEQLLRESFELYQGSTRNQRYLAAAEYFLAETLLAQNQLVEAESRLHSALGRLNNSDTPRWGIERSSSALGEVLYRQGRTEQGRRMIAESHRWLSEDPSAPAAAKDKARQRMRLLPVLERQPATTEKARSTLRPNGL